MGNYDPGGPREPLTGIVVEHPRIYPGHPARPNDIIKLAIRAGLEAGYLACYSKVNPDWVEPATWKGGAIRKEWSIPRIQRRLTADELATVATYFAHGGPKGRPVAEGRRHDVWDAIGIGLWAVGRQA